MTNSNYNKVVANLNRNLIKLQDIYEELEIPEKDSNGNEDNPFVNSPPGNSNSTLVDLSEEVRRKTNFISRHIKSPVLTT